jgi:tripeptide aminopeptidase
LTPACRNIRKKKGGCTALGLSSLFVLLSLPTFPTVAQTPTALADDPAVKAAFEIIKRNEPDLLIEQQRICEVPSPPFEESVRAAEFKKLFEQLGLASVHIDKAGNVIGTRPGTHPRPNLVLAAHLDTVFPAGTNVKVQRTGDLMSGPGISDDCRGLAVLLGVIRALNEAKITTPGTITFVADVGEEGLGDLRGMKELFGASLRGSIDAFISVDGTGASITNGGVGSYRYKVIFKGPGGHSYASFGMANPIQAMGRAIAKIDQFEVPEKPKRTFNVGRVGGGTSVNAIPFEAWMEVDLRSVDMGILNALNDKFKAAVNDSVAEENQRWHGRSAVAVSTELVGMRPAGHTPESSPIVKAALEVNQVLGAAEPLGDGSTDANVPMNLGIPAITVGGGGIGRGAHSLNETFDAHDSWKGTQRALLLALVLAR